jgi:hypothetical protein
MTLKEALERQARGEAVLVDLGRPTPTRRPHPRRLNVSPIEAGATPEDGAAAIFYCG